jgi:Ras-related protein Rab-8A
MMTFNIFICQSTDLSSDVCVESEGYCRKFVHLMKRFSTHLLFFRTITTAYYRGAMGILLIYDVTDEHSFSNIRNWIRNIEQHAAANVNKVLIGNKADMHTDKKVETTRGQALADEYGIRFFEASAKTNMNVVEAFTSIAVDIKKRLVDVGGGGTKTAGGSGAVDLRESEGKKGKCC